VRVSASGAESTRRAIWPAVVSVPTRVALVSREEPGEQLHQVDHGFLVPQKPEMGTDAIHAAAPPPLERP
jgi:hypothetical protein